MNNSIKVLLVTIAFCAGPAVTAADAETIAPCAGVTEIKSKSRPLNQLGMMMVTLLILEKQGEADFRPKYAAPASACLLEKFDVAGTTVNAIYTPFEKGEQTLHYRFTTEASGKRAKFLSCMTARRRLRTRKATSSRWSKNAKRTFRTTRCFAISRRMPW